MKRNEMINVPIPAFHFRVLFPNTKHFPESDSSFESISGIQGGWMPSAENNIDQAKDAVVFQPVVLRRATVPPQSSALLQWVMHCLNNRVKESLAEILIQVLDEHQQPSISILLKDVTLNYWSLQELHAQQNNLLMEEFSFNYASIEIR